jgi:arginase
MNIHILLVPYDSGRHRERNGRGPQHLRPAIESMLTQAGHHVLVDEITLSQPFTTEITSMFALAREIAERVRKCRAEGWLPLVLSGNCDASLGTVSGCGCGDTAVVWFDAHGEATTPDTTVSGFLDGMGISTMTGQCWQRLARTVPGFEPVPGDRIVLIGARDVEPAEADLHSRIGVRRVQQPSDLAAAFTPLKPAVDGLYLHLDLDVLDPSAAIANPWPTPNGPGVDDVRLAVADLCRDRDTPVRAIGLASYDPAADRDGRAQQAALDILAAAIDAIDLPARSATTDR